jgi:hypothetical protein
LPSRKLVIHAGTKTTFLDLSSWDFDSTVLEAVGRLGRNARTYNVEGTCILLPLLPTTDPPYKARIMMIGGGGTPTVGIRTPATQTCEILDMTRLPLTWQLAASMSRPRVMPDSVLLPDGKVLVINGSSTGYADNGANPVYEAEIYDPVTDIWTTVCPMTVPRLYHATAILLPDGRVMTAGTDSMWNPDPFHEAQLRLEIFSPPYLFRGPQPVISVAPDEINYDSEFEIRISDSARMISNVALLRCGSVTHSFNSDQRYIGLQIIRRGRKRLTLRAPPDGYVAPPGYYMLFILNDAGVPSVAKFVRLY